MKPDEIKALSADEAKQKLVELKAAYFNLRFRHETGQLDNTSMLEKTKKDIARVKTVLSAYNR
ncbi:50S ribosomal protein L29 [Desulfosudis oleivorans]|uniref:Large ribosomal subunit protein uL29 n=1 Tax=Desulfosudis oleivorans (strain DSM 6200 / JCM 39069 / Hxd3) TaxID=96561 RepID=RL29_DESOH|nr:50S ribosomal protein L29 [Desulfosudis oleivorans]A8ZV65.1 RecName: Full=Large ribosomal subunit protein uL29; AltName: Full=50S ribosomal protein L29 [Desulfosudis oleivorans Hxd3]ABW66526.1 ribosomal protein L29 [Desulfosudis oleivorans Hxd3]